MNEGEWKLDSEEGDDLYEYKNLGVTKNCFRSSSSDIDDNIEKTRKKARMILSMNFYRYKVNPFIYIKIWQQACIPSLLFGTELMSITPSILSKVERCQSWFLKKAFFVPDYAHSLLLLRLSGLNSIESEIHIRRLYFSAF